MKMFISTMMKQQIPITKFLFPTKKNNINDNILKKSMENQLEEVKRKKKKNSTNSKTLATKIMSQQ